MKMPSRASLILTVFAPVLCAQRPPQLATQQIEVGRKQALVIGNDAYPSAPLEYPDNDAAGMEATLRKLGFDVRTYRNLDLAHMESAIDDFAVSLTDGSFAFVYYSGTGVQALRKNYLVPVDFAGARDWEGVKRQAYPVSRLEDTLEARHARLRVIVLEASRGTRFRVDGMGLEPMRVNREGTLIAFSGYSSSDVDKEEGYASNSMYTKYLMAALLTPGMNLRVAFQKARDDAAHASFKRGNPEIADGIVGRYYLIPADAAATAALWNAGAESRRETLGAETWAQIKDSKDPHDFELLARYSPDSEYAPLALVTAARMTRDADAAVTKIDAKDGLAYRWIPPGMFYMGCLHWDNDPQHEDVPGSCDPDEKPQHDVTLTKGFWLGQTEVTQEAYRRVTGQNPSTFKGAQLPVETVNWSEAQAYCKAAGMRLPTEAEWDYAAQGGMRLGQAWRASGAWDQERSQSKTHDVGLEPPNPYGLYDMAGNVWEWVADWYGEKYYQSSPAKDPPGPSGGKEKVFRGGSFNLNSVYMTQSLRGHNKPDFRSNSLGFRCAGD